MVLQNVYLDSMKFLLLITTLLTLFVVALGQQAPNSLEGTRSVLVNVLDVHGTPIRDLRPRDFRVTVNGRRTSVLDARYSLAPRRIVVILDISGSMTDRMSNKWQIAQHAVDDLLTQAPRDVPIALLTFTGNVHDVFDFSQSRMWIERWLKDGPAHSPKVNSSAKTALFDATLKGLALLNPVQKGDAIYAITDGGDDASKTSAEQAKAALLQAGVRLFAFLLADPQPPVTEVQQKEQSFLSMVADSGGFIFALAGHQQPSAASWNTYYPYDRTNADKIAAETSELNVLVNGFWRLDLPLSNVSKKSEMKIELVDRKEKGLTLIYPRALFPFR